MNIKEMIEKQISKLHDSIDFYERTEIKNIKGVQTTESDGKILFIVSLDYDLFKSVMKIARKETKQKIVSGQYVFSLGQFVFFFENKLIQLRFRCSPENVPKELLPETTCRIEKEIIPEKHEYKIVCD